MKCLICAIFTHIYTEVGAKALWSFCLLLFVSQIQNKICLVLSSESHDFNGGILWVNAVKIL